MRRIHATRLFLWRASQLSMQIEDSPSSVLAHLQRLHCDRHPAALLSRGVTTMEPQDSSSAYKGSRWNYCNSRIRLSADGVSMYSGPGCQKQCSGSLHIAECAAKYALMRMHFVPRHVCKSQESKSSAFLLHFTWAVPQPYNISEG